MTRSNRIILLTAAVSAALALAGYTISRPPTAVPMPADWATLPGEAVPLVAGVQHIPTRYTSHEPYNSVPPTSGPHVAQTVAPGVYREEIPEEVQVHALEHGHVLVQYAPALPDEQVRQLEALAHRYSRDVIVAPYGKLSAGIALTGWGRILRLDQVETGPMQEFIERLRGRYNHGWTQQDR